MKVSPYVVELASPVLIGLGLICILPVLLFALTEDIPLSLGWCFGAGIAAITFIIVGVWLRKFSFQALKRDAEKQVQLEAEKKENEFIQICRKQEQAFQEGTVSEYPTTDATEYGLPMKSDEVCYLVALNAILGRGNAHQLEASTGLNAGIDLKVFKLGGNKGRKDSYSTVVYDKTNPGTLLITSQRIAFISKPGIFLEVAPSQIVTAAWSETYVMLRTTLTPDENTNLLAFSLINRVPASLYVAAMLRLAEDYAHKRKRAKKE